MSTPSCAAEVAKALGGKLEESSPWAWWDEPPAIRSICVFPDRQPLIGHNGDWDPEHNLADAMEALEAATGEHGLSTGSITTTR